MIAIDIYFLMNFVFDILLMTVALCLARERLRIWRILLSAFAGALIGSAVLILRLSAIKKSVITYVLCPVCMCGIAGKKRSLALTVIGFYLAAFGIGGSMELFVRGMRLPWWKLMALMALSSMMILVFSILLQRHRDNKTLFLKTELTFRSRRLETYGLWDTGNRLRSITGKPVHMLDKEGAKKLLEGEELEVLFMLCGEQSSSEMQDCFTDLPLPVPVRFHTVGEEKGCLPAIRMDRLTVWKNGKKIDVEAPLIGISKTIFQNEEGCHVILNTGDL